MQLFCVNLQELTSYFIISDLLILFVIKSIHQFYLRFFINFHNFIIRYFKFDFRLLFTFDYFESCFVLFLLLNQNSLLVNFNLRVYCKFVEIDFQFNCSIIFTYCNYYCLYQKLNFSIWIFQEYFNYSQLCFVLLY